MSILIEMQEIINEKPDNFLPWAIVSTVLCCLPFGIVAIVYASKVDTLWYAQKQAEADLLVHVEPTGLAHRWESRLSFSTKLIDYMQSYRPILAYGLLEQASLAHLKAKDAAFVATNEAELERTLREILARPALLEEYAAKGWACGAACHDIRRIHALLRQDFEEVCNAGCTD